MASDRVTTSKEADDAVLTKSERKKLKKEKKKLKKEKKTESSKKKPAEEDSSHHHDQTEDEKKDDAGDNSNSRDARVVEESDPSHTENDTEKKKRERNERKRKRKEEKKKAKKRQKKKQDQKQDSSDSDNETSSDEMPSKRLRKNDDTPEATTTTADDNDQKDDNDATPTGDPRIVESFALDYGGVSEEGGITLMLFYQYVEPIWSLEKYQQVLKDMEELGNSLELTGRMRVAREGLNCTLTANSREGMLKFCRALRQQPEFKTTEFKLTNDLPKAQKFPQLKVIEVIELVHYGLEGEKAPPIQEYRGVHLEPQDYHKKIAEKDTVMIDVRNHYEAIIGHFQPPNKRALLDPLMRKSTEFPVWLDKQETKEKLKGKQVLMYCTGGIRCERATALLKYKMENDPEIKDLGIQEVYQLQGGIDKYFKAYPDGGFWKGKNYVFDKRFAHKPAAVEGSEKRGEATPEPMSKCEACQKPWDRFRGKRRCPTCGVPSLICKECFIKASSEKKLLKGVRCDLCVKENITSKHQLRNKEQCEIDEYEQKLVERGLIPQPEAKGERLKVTASTGSGSSSAVGKDGSKRSKKKYDNQQDSTAKNGGKVPPNPDNVTRLYLKNMCRNSMNEETLLEFLPGITHLVWKSEGKTGKFLGQGWVEMATPEDAAKAVAKNGQRVLGRPLYINYQPADSKDVWPLPSSRIQ